MARFSRKDEIKSLFSVLIGILIFSFAMLVWSIASYGIVIIGFAFFIPIIRILVTQESRLVL